MTTATIRELCAHPYDQAFDEPLIVCNGKVEGRFYAGLTGAISPREFIVSQCLGNCLAPLFPPGSIIMIDPFIHAYSGAVVMVYRPWVRAGSRVFLKILQFLVGRWHLVTLDENPPLPLNRGDVILGVLTYSEHVDGIDVAALEEKYGALGVRSYKYNPEFWWQSSGPAATQALAEKQADAARVPFGLPNFTVIGASRQPGPLRPFGGPLTSEHRSVIAEAGVNLLSWPPGPGAWSSSRPSGTARQEAV